MSTLNYTLLDAQKVQPVVSALRQLLADVQVYYTNLRDFHWNVQGTNFYNLHTEFERLYDGIATKADDIAERLLQLGATPEHRYSEYLKISQVKEAEVTRLPVTAPSLRCSKPRSNSRPGARGFGCRSRSRR